MVLPFPVVSALVPYYGGIGLKSDPETGQPYWSFHDFRQPPQANSGTVGQNLYEHLPFLSFRIRPVLTFMAFEAADDPRIVSNCTVISAARDKDENSAVSSFSSEIMKFVHIDYNVMWRSTNTFPTVFTVCYKYQYVICNISMFECVEVWAARWRSLLRHCAKSQKVAGSIPVGVIGIFHWYNPSGHTMVLGSTHMCLLSWNLRTSNHLAPSEPVQGCTAIALLRPTCMGVRH